MTYPLIDADSLRHALDGDTPPLVLDCRVRLNDPEAGAALWRQAHVPGSLHLDLGRDLSGPRDAGSGTGGRHPLPSHAAFTATLQRLGVAPEREVVVLDDAGGQLAAARAWWMLSEWAGHPRVRLLDGGLAAWEGINGDWEVGEGAPPAPSQWTPDFDDSRFVALEEMASSAALKVDARAGERYRGEVEPMDPRAGHIPGAVNRPCSLNLDDNGRFKSPEALARELPQALPQEQTQEPLQEQPQEQTQDELAGASQQEPGVIAYCGSGVTACHDILAYRLAGLPTPRLYVGSWSEWSGDPARPAETGPATAS